MYESVYVKVWRKRIIDLEMIEKRTCDESRIGIRAESMRRIGREWRSEREREWRPGRDLIVGAQLSPLAD